MPVLPLVITVFIALVIISTLVLLVTLPVLVFLFVLMFPVILISILLACLPLLLLLPLTLNVLLKELLPFLLSWNLKTSNVSDNTTCLPRHDHTCTSQDTWASIANAAATGANHMRPTAEGRRHCVRDVSTCERPYMALYIFDWHVFWSGHA